MTQTRIVPDDQSGVSLALRLLQRALPLVMLVVLVGGIAGGTRLAFSLGQPIPGFAMMWRKELGLYTVSFATPSHWPGIEAGVRINDQILCVNGFFPANDTVLEVVGKRVEGERCPNGRTNLDRVFAAQYATQGKSLELLLERSGHEVLLEDIQLESFDLWMLAEIFAPFFVLGLGLLVIGYTVYRVNAGTRINLVLAILCTIMAAFIFDQVSSIYFPNQGRYTKYLDIIQTAPLLPFIAPLFLDFVFLSMPSNNLSRIIKRILPTIYVFSLLITIFATYSFIFDNSILIVVFLALCAIISIISVLFACFGLAWNFLISKSPRTRKQAILILIGVVMAFISLLPYISYYLLAMPLVGPVQGAPYLGLGFIAILAYTILRYQLFNSKARTLTFLLITISCIFVANIVYLGIGQNMSFLPILAAALTTGFVLGAKRGPTAFLNHLLRREILDYQSVAAFSQKVTGLKNTEILVQDAVRSFQADLETEHVDVWLIDTERKMLEYLCEGQMPGVAPLPPGLSDDLLSHPEPIHASHQAPSSFRLLMAGEDEVRWVALWAPLVERGQAVGLMGLGPRWTGEVYDDQDLQLVGILARQMALAILNTRQWERLQATSHLVLQAEENERRKIARELHDTILQFLLVLTYGLDDLKEQQMAVGGGIAGELERWQDRISVEAGQLRNLLNYLRAPELLVQQGLVRSLQYWLEGVRQETTMQVEAYLQPEVEALLSTEAKVAIYRTVREAVHNALKHSGGSRVVVRLGCEGEQGNFTVEDDGRGFDVATVWQGGGNAGDKGYSSLLDMRLHMESVGGGVEVRSGKGTVVRGWAPLV